MEVKTTRKKVLLTLRRLENIETPTDEEKSLRTYFSMIRTNGKSKRIVLYMSLLEMDVWTRYNK